MVEVLERKEELFLEFFTCYEQLLQTRTKLKSYFDRGCDNLSICRTKSMRHSFSFGTTAFKGHEFEANKKLNTKLELLDNSTKENNPANLLGYLRPKEVHKAQSAFNVTLDSCIEIAKLTKKLTELELEFKGLNNLGGGEKMKKSPKKKKKKKETKKVTAKIAGEEGNNKKTTEISASTKSPKKRNP